MFVIGLVKWLGNTWMCVRIKIFNEDDSAFEYKKNSLGFKENWFLLRNTKPSYFNWIYNRLTLEVSKQFWCSANITVKMVPIKGFKCALLNVID